MASTNFDRCADQGDAPARKPHQQHRQRAHDAVGRQSEAEQDADQHKVAQRRLDDRQTWDDQRNRLQPPQARTMSREADQHGRAPLDHQQQAE